MKKSMNKLPKTNPLYLVTSAEGCWRCQTGQEVIAFATYRFGDSDSAELNDADDAGEPFILVNIVEMPNEILQHVQNLHP
jgi:hypothetical protein